MGKVARDLSLDQDPRESPVYSIPEAAHYLRIPPAMLRAWVVGRYYPEVHVHDDHFPPDARSALL